MPLSYYNSVWRISANMKCLLCDKNEVKSLFKGLLLHKYEVQYYQCPQCGLIFTESPYWLDEAYSDSITCVDTGIMSRNVDFVLATNMLIKTFFDKKGLFVDWGGGYGIFTRMMRDLGYNFMWKDKYSPNLLSSGFEYTTDMKEKVELVTAFELFEHFSKPLDEIENLFSMTDSVLFSTLIYDDEFQFQNFEKWWYYVPQTGQHIVFYSKKTLEYIAKSHGLNYYKINNGLHIITRKKINSLKIRCMVNSRFGLFLQLMLFKINRKNGLTDADFNRMSNTY